MIMTGCNAQHQQREIREVNMEEKAYKTMGSTGGGSLAIGICILVTGIVSGILLIVNGARLLKNRERLTF